MPSKVVMKADVYRCMWTHVLSTEAEEIMGMLLGEITSDDVLVVHGLKVAQRADKRPDRVEISDLQMVKGVDAAEALSLRTGKQLRVLGWYHSHPKLTVWPSHVDLNTQLSYQGLDEHFVGIICSGFKECVKDDLMKESEFEVVCFQVVQYRSGEIDQNVIPLEVDASSSKTLDADRALAELTDQLFKEEMAAMKHALGREPTHPFQQAELCLAFRQRHLDITKNISLPLLQNLRLRRHIVQQQIKELETAFIQDIKRDYPIKEDGDREGKYPSAPLNAIKKSEMEDSD